MKVALLILSIFVAVWFLSVNIIKTIMKNDIPWFNFVIMAAAFTAVITHFIGIW